MPHSHLKVVSCWNTLAASKLGSRLCRQHRPGPPFAQRIPLRWGMAANVLLLPKPAPVIKTLSESPFKGSGYFCHWWWFNFGEKNQNKTWKQKTAGWFCSCVQKKWELSSSHNMHWLYTHTPFVLLYVTEQVGEDEMLLKEASVLISSEGSLLFFPHPFFPEPVHFKSWPEPCVPCNMFT